MKLNGIPVIAPIVPNDSRDKYPTHREEYGSGGYRSVQTLELRNSIPAERQKIGMLVNVLDEDKIYKLVSISNNLTSINWEELETGSGNISSLISLYKVVQNKEDLLSLDTEVIDDGKVVERGISIGDKVYVISEGITYICTSLSNPLIYGNYEIDSIKGAIDVAGCIPGNPPSEQNVHIFITGRKLVIPSNFAGSKAYALKPQTGSPFIFSIKVNEIEVGEMTFNPDNKNGIFSSNNQEITLDTNDIFTISSPLTDPNLEDVAWYILGVLV